MKARDLARDLGTGLAGDGDLEISGVAPLHRAAPSDLSFLSNPKYREQALSSSAGALLVEEGVELAGRTLLPCRNPYAAFARALALFHPAAPFEPGIHPTAVIGRECSISPSASVGPHAAIGDGAAVGDRSVIGAGCFLGERSRVGEDCRLYPRVVLYGGTVLGDRVILHSGCVIGSDGFGFAREGGRHLKVPQVGRVVIESDVEIGANTAVDRGTLDETRVGEGSKIDNLVQIGHNVSLGPRCILVAQSGISGSTRLGAEVVIAGQSGVVGHVELGDGARVGAKSAVTKDVPPGALVTGHPAQEHRLWLKERALAGRLGEMLERLNRLEREVARLASSKEDPA